MDHLGQHRPSGTPPFWRPGDQIDWTYTTYPSWVFPMTIVQDDDRALVAWLEAGTRGLMGIRADGRELRADKSTMFTTDRIQVERPWVDFHNLRIHPPGRRWSTWLFFDEVTGAFEGWYCNIEAPHVRDDRATYTRDHVLDVWVEPDQSVERKDEDELAMAIAQGRYTQAEADGITAVADEIEAVIAAWGSPFCDGWETFRPDPAWPVPALR